MMSTSGPKARSNSRRRLWNLLGVLAVVLVTSGSALWWLYQPRQSAPRAESTGQPDSVNLPRAQADAKDLPEYAELAAVGLPPLTDAEISRMIDLSGHPNAWIRVRARARLEKVTDGPRRTDAVSAVAAGLREESISMRTISMHILANMRAVEREGELRALLASQSEDDRTVARRALRQMGLSGE